MSDNSTVCEVCNGTGVIVEELDDDGNIVDESECMFCNGTGTCS